MRNRAIANFDVTRWDPRPYEDGGPEDGALAEVAGPALGQVFVLKSYRGDLKGEGRARLLTCQADVDDRSAGAGYIASERISGTLDGREGAFVVHHWGIVASGAAPRTAGHVVPGSGTGDLSGISGEMEIAVEPDGAHVLRLDYEFE